MLISRNDYGANLFNGDIGLIFRTRDATGTRWVAVFPGRDSLPSEAEMEHRNWAWVEGEDYGGDLSIVQTLSVERLPPHETVFAMTIHKSQGSEFDHVMMALPDAPKRSRILTRELIYTGVTRAKREITIVGRKELLADAVAESITRASCLRDKLCNEDI